MRLLIRIGITMCALWAAAHWVHGITADGSVLALAGVALVFGVVNVFVKPILKLLSLPVVVLTLGLFLLVINALMLMLTSALSGSLGLGFHVDGFVPALYGSIVISLVSMVLSLFIHDHPRMPREPER
ncbi:MAG TPA: phage holin family protein [Gemmatimonadaceae bacterium]|nr:phage holin family protein [Gemmatimonadaceae bacterium]